MPSLKQEWNRHIDSRLIRKAKQGDARAFEQLVERYQRPLYLCIVRMVFQHDDTDELVQETFVRIYQNLNRFDHHYPFYPWARRIAMNLTLNYLKSRSSRKSASLEGAVAIPNGNPEADPLHRAEQNELQSGVKKALASLPEEQRMVFILRTREEMSYDEIAEALQISPGTVMSRLNRARARLKELLAHYL
jgi:RNA polymerase sigma-70 factor, ECF subfamily